MPKEHALNSGVAMQFVEIGGANQKFWWGEAEKNYILSGTKYEILDKWNFVRDVKVVI